LCRAGVANTLRIKALEEKYLLEAVKKVHALMIP